jgi:hypothetical protein
MGRKATYGNLHFQAVSCPELNKNKMLFFTAEKWDEGPVPMAG